MITKVRLNYLRVAPRKVRLVADLVRGKSVFEAQNVLNFTPQRSAPILLKLLRSAMANAKNQFQLDESNLYISKITVDEGPKLKRWRPRARGQAYEIQKKTSHVTLVLDTIKPTELKKVKKGVKKETSKLTEAKGIKERKPKTEPVFQARKAKIDKGIKRIFKRKAF